MHVWGVPCARWSAPMMPLFRSAGDEADKLRFHVNRGGQPRSRGGRRNDPESFLDRIKFIRISMLTDPALDAGRHEFEIADTARPGSATRKKSVVSQRKWLDTAGAGNLSPDYRWNVLWRALAQHVGRAPDGHCLSE